MKESIKNIIINLTKFIPDEQYLKIMYRFEMGKNLNLNPPVTFNEKLQWLKLHNRKPEYTKMVDKYLVREYVKEKVGEQYLVPLLGVWEKPEDIDFSLLPDKFVLKCNHDCEGLSICTDKSDFDIEEARLKLKKCLNRNFYYQGREWPYKDVKPLIIAEKYLTDEGSNQLTDYKVFCFNGVPKMIQVDYDRFSGHKRQFFDLNWKRMDISFHFPSDNKVIECPKPLNEMIELSKKLSAGFPHLRTDFFIIGEKIYVGEMTFYHGTGMGKWSPESFDKTMGEWLDLSEISKGKIK